MIELSDSFLDQIAERLAPRLAAHMPAGDGTSPWMTFEELCEYTKIPKGTLRHLVAKGEIPKYGRKTHTFHRDEVDEALLGYSRRQQSRKVA